MSLMSIKVPYYYADEKSVPKDCMTLQVIDGQLGLVQDGAIVARVPLGISGEVVQHVSYRVTIRSGQEHIVTKGGLPYIKYLAINAVDGTVEMEETLAEAIAGYTASYGRGKSIVMLDAILHGEIKIRPLYKIMDYATIIGVDSAANVHTLSLGDVANDEGIHYGSSVLTGQERMAPFGNYYKMYFRYANNASVVVIIEDDEPVESGVVLAQKIEDEINVVLGSDKVAVSYIDNRIVVQSLEQGPIHLGFLDEGLGFATGLGLANGELVKGINYLPTKLIFPEIGAKEVDIDEIVNGKIKVTMATPPEMWSRCYVVTTEEPVHVDIFLGS